MTVLSCEEKDIDIQNGEMYDFVCSIAKNCSDLNNLTLLSAWYVRNKKMKGKISVIYHKRVLLVENLSLRAHQIYSQILLSCPSDSDILAIKQLIDDGPSLNKKVSGRTIDTLVTRFPKYHNVFYYLDVSDKKDTKIVPYSEADGRQIILFDIGSSYRSKMHQYSKTYFDCFGRGDEVKHILSTGEAVHISLCQFTFYIWASRFRVFEFLQDEFESIIVVRQQSQKNTYKPKRKKRRKTKEIALVVADVKKSILCPRMTHGRTTYNIVDRVIMKPTDQIRIKPSKQHCKTLFEYSSQ